MSEAVVGPYLAQVGLTPPLLPKLEGSRYTALGEALTPQTGIATSSPSTTSSLRDARLNSSPSQLPPVKKEKRRPAPLALHERAASRPRSPSEAEPEARRAFDRSVPRGAVHSGSQTPRSARRALPLMPPGSVPSVPGSAFTSGSSSADLEVLGLEDLERICKLGQGTSAMVEKHRHVPSGRELALKIMQAGDIAEPQRKAILLELRTFSKCRSPHIVDYYGAFFHDNRIYMALEYMNAGALSSILAAKKKANPDFQVPERLLANITWQVLDGLEHLHSEMHVIHRDIKPSNLLLSSTGIVKITDFGVSGELEDDIEQKNKVTFVGTIHYMSPERVVGKPYQYNSDTWSLGLTLMECILMRYPYSREEESGKLTVWELMKRIDTDEPPSLPPKHGSQLQDFLQQALQKDPTLRPGASTMKAHGWLEGFSPLRILELAMWIAPMDFAPPEEAPKQRSRPNPFQMPHGGGYRACSPAKEAREAPHVPPRLPESSPPNKTLTPRVPETSPAAKSDVPPRLPEGSPAAKVDLRDTAHPPRLPEGSLKPPRGPAASGAPAGSPESEPRSREHLDMPKMDQSWHGGRCNPFSAFQAEASASPEACKTSQGTSFGGAEGELLI